MGLDDFLALPEIDERRLELIDGEVYEKMSPRWGHGALAIELGAALRSVGFASAEPRAIIPQGSGADESSLLPDVAFYNENPPSPDDWMRRAPDVAIEILSPGQGRRDVRAKVDISLQFGVGAVWVFDIDRESVDVYEGAARRTLGRDDRLASAAVPGFEVHVGELFDRALGRD